MKCFKMMHYIELKFFIILKHYMQCIILMNYYMLYYIILHYMELYFLGVHYMGFLLYIM